MTIDIFFEFKKVCFTVWGDKIDELKRFKVDQVINVFFNLESREYNGKWYADIRAWRIDADKTEQEQSLQQGATPVATASTALPNIPPVSDDDLPF